MDNSKENIEIDLTLIDWNNLKPEEFQKFSEKIQENKENKERKKREITKLVSTLINNQFYQLPENIAIRLKTMKSQLSKDKLIEEIMINYKPIEVI